MNYNPDDFEAAIHGVVSRYIARPATMSQILLAALMPNEAKALAMDIIQELKKGKDINDGVAFDMTCERLHILAGYDRTKHSIDEAFAELNKAIIAKALGLPYDGPTNIIH